MGWKVPLYFPSVGIALRNETKQSLGSSSFKMWKRERPSKLLPELCKEVDAGRTTPL